ncbi:MAG: YihY/virulence factor BrkB family protein [Angustibacter sp.]
MSSGTPSSAADVPPALQATRASRARRLLLGAWALTRETVSVCLRYRVTGLASEAGFFALLSLPPLVLGLIGGVGYLGDALGRSVTDQVSQEIERLARRIFTADTVASTIVPTLQDVLRQGRLDVVSLAFLVSLWSGSRVLNVFIDTIAIMYGQGGVRGIVRTRALSFSLYTFAVVLGAVVLPLVLLGPSLLADLLPARVDFLLLLYWPVVSVLTVASLASLYHVATPCRTSWRRDLPGAVLALVIWVLSAFVVRAGIGASVRASSIYGPLTATIIVLIWLYFLAIAVLIGAALNAASRQLWPVRGESRSPLARWDRLRGPVTPVRDREDEPPGQHVTGPVGTVDPTVRRSRKGSPAGSSSRPPG